MPFYNKTLNLSHLRRGLFYAGLWLLSLGLTACDTTHTTQQNFYVFGTEVQLLIVGAEPKQAQQA